MVVEFREKLVWKLDAWMHFGVLFPPLPPPGSVASANTRLQLNHHKTEWTAQIHRLYQESVAS